jgi:peptidoglycan/LPS O-acetylase OafA/YrhL
MPQLDSLRFFAILGVLVLHDWHPRPLPWIFGGLDWGMIGVRLFFVLSGFLITGILLDCRRRVEQGHRRSALARRFYVRRFLRIYPIYYAVLGVIILAGVAQVRHLWPWLLSYTANIYIWHHQRWIGPTGIFWTLAVEEQFYLIWPLLVLFLPKRALIPVLVGMICMAPIFRLFASIREPGDMVATGYTSGTFTLAVFDSLGMGALLAVLSALDQTRHHLRRWLTRLALPVGVVGLLALLALKYYGGSAINFVLGETALALILAWLVAGASEGFSGRIGRALEFRPLPYLGKISYGIYVFHAFVPLALVWVARRLGMRYAGVSGFTNFLLVSSVTVVIASLSWRFFERPINDLKRFFPYRDDRRAPSEPATIDVQMKVPSLLESR